MSWEAIRFGLLWGSYIWCMLMVSKAFRMPEHTDQYGWTTKLVCVIFSPVLIAVALLAKFTGVGK